MMQSMLSPGVASLVLFGAFFFLLAMRVPVAFALGLACLPVLVYEPRRSPMMLFNETFKSYNSFILLAVPLLLLTANLMGVGGMLGRGRGAIINIASLASHRGWPRSALYAIAKAGVLSLTRTLGAEWASRGVRVNAISPGFFMTELNRDKMSPERKALALARTPAGRFGEVDELAGAAVYLASASAGFVNGQTIAVDGGFLATGL